MTLQEFAAKRPFLFWSTRDYENLSDEIIVESILEYGEWLDVKKAISITGSKKIAEIFYKKVNSNRHNFDPKVVNYFKLYFNHASRNIN
ncbi:MAG: hypothetical protein WCI63_04505 [bacterium]